MVNTIISLLFAAAAVSAVQVDFVAPATSYIYRSDNNGPANIIQLGAHPYQQPHAFAPPLPLVQPVKLEAIEAYDLAPAPLPYIAAKPIVVEDAEEDSDSDDSSEDYADEDEAGIGHGHAHESGAGSEYGEEHHAAHGEKGAQGYNSKGHHAKGEAGVYGKEHKEGFYGESEGKESAHHDEANAHGKHHESGQSYKGGNHGHKAYASKGEDITGYHKVFNKNEYKKDHDFYDVADNSGHFNKHGYAKEHHGSQDGGHKEGGKHDSAYNKGDYGKSGYHSNGHIDDGETGHSAEHGFDSHYNEHEDYGKKGGSEHGKEYAYADDNGADDDDDDDDKE